MIDKDFRLQDSNFSYGVRVTALIIIDNQLLTFYDKKQTLINFLVLLLK